LVGRDDPLAVLDGLGDVVSLGDDAFFVVLDVNDVAMIPKLSSNRRAPQSGGQKA
jgi:hypothetical protein